MRKLLFTDTHFRSTSPENSLEDIVETAKKKIEEVVQIANDYEVRAVLHGGDLFDIPNPGLSVMGEIISIMRKFKAPIYIINGNHDIYGHNIMTLNRTLLGFLSAIGMFDIINGRTVTIKDRNAVVNITGSGYQYNIDGLDKSAYLVKKKDCDVAIHMVHGMLLDKAAFPGTEYTLIDDIKDKTQADVTISGHYHLGFNEVHYKDKYFVNPGSLLRLSNHPSEISRMPKVLLIDIDGGINLKYITLKCAKAGYEVLDRSKIEEKKYRLQKLNNFLSDIKASSISRTDPYSILDSIIKSDEMDGRKLSEDVIDEIRLRFAEAEEAYAKGD